MKNNGALPVTWLNIQAQRVNSNAVSVNWSVATESNIKNYVVQYSEDAAAWKDGCTVNADNLGNYSCVLNLGNDKKYFFKIKETDIDGRYNFSKVVEINKQLQETRFAISPNPFHQDATLNYSMPTAAEGTLRLSNSAGSLLWLKKIMFSTSGTLSIPTTRLPSGIYNLQVITSTATQSLILLKD